MSRMIEFTQGDMLRADVDALVNTVNCVGVMGRGIAEQFKRMFPENYRVYEAACKHKEVVPGKMLIVATGQLTSPRFIVNFPTKRHWRGASRMADIESGLAALVQEVQARGIRSLAIPPLGCGLGGLDWREVRPLIEQALGALPDVRVLVFEPGASNAPVKQPAKNGVPKQTPGRAVLVELMARYLGGLPFGLAA
jgi:O-acetyl-ADP-ribose deacetylase (regulator of RNase III)